jgi:competence protein ComEC
MFEAARCRAGQRWRWDGVEFEFLYPSPQPRARRTISRACCAWPMPAPLHY